MAEPLIPRPFNPDAVAKIAESTRHYYKVVAYPIDGDAVELEVFGMIIGFEEDRAPHISARITCGIPESQEVIDSLDGRKGTRVSIELGYDLDNGKADAQIVADLMVGTNTLKLDAKGAEMELTAFSDELRVQGQEILGDEKINKTGIEPLVTSILTGTQFIGEKFIGSDFPDNYGAAELTEMDTIEPGDNAWDIIQEAGERTNTWIYCPMGRDWLIVPRPEIVSTPHHTLEDGENGTIISATKKTDRKDFFNMVILNYTWRNPPAVNEFKLTGSAFISHGEFNVAKVGAKVHREDIRKKVTKAQAHAAAKSILARKLSKGHTYDVTALALYSLRPGHTVRLKLFNADQLLLVQSVSFSPEVGLMDLVLRKPELGEIYI